MTEEDDIYSVLKSIIDNISPILEEKTNNAKAEATRATAPSVVAAATGATSPIAPEGAEAEAETPPPPAPTTPPPTTAPPAPTTALPTPPTAPTAPATAPPTAPPTQTISTSDYKKSLAYLKNISSNGVSTIVKYIQELDKIRHEQSVDVNSIQFSELEKSLRINNTFLKGYLPELFYIIQLVSVEDIIFNEKNELLDKLLQDVLFKELKAIDTNLSTLSTLYTKLGDEVVKSENYSSMEISYNRSNKSYDVTFPDFLYDAFNSITSKMNEKYEPFLTITLDAAENIKTLHELERQKIDKNYTKNAEQYDEDTLQLNYIKEHRLNELEAKEAAKAAAIEAAAKAKAEKAEEAAKAAAKAAEAAETAARIATSRADTASTAATISSSGNESQILEARGAEERAIEAEREAHERAIEAERTRAAQQIEAERARAAEIASEAERARAAERAREAAPAPEAIASAPTLATASPVTALASTVSRAAASAPVTSLATAPTTLASTVSRAAASTPEATAPTTLASTVSRAAASAPVSRGAASAPVSRAAAAPATSASAPAPTILVGRKAVAPATRAPPRKPAWFRDLFGFDETNDWATNVNHFQMDDLTLVCKTAPNKQRQYVGRFECLSVSDLAARYRNIVGHKWAKTDGLSFAHLAAPEGVGPLHYEPSNAGAVFQAASQFNCLEMIGPDVSPTAGVAIYINDRTQGPACALACPAATVYRNYLVQHEGNTGQHPVQIDNLKEVGVVVGNNGGSYWVMQNGYAMPVGRGSLAELASRLRTEPNLVEQAEAALRVGVHWETSVAPPLEHRVCQVYASALPCAYARGPPDGDWEPFARLVLRAAYDATLAVAAIQSITDDNKRVKCYLTTLGGGVFGNRYEWIRDAIKDALNKYIDKPIDVILVHYASLVDADWARDIQPITPATATAKPTKRPHQDSFGQMASALTSFFPTLATASAPAPATVTESIAAMKSEITAIETAAEAVKSAASRTIIAVAAGNRAVEEAMQAADTAITLAPAKPAIAPAIGPAIPAKPALALAIPTKPISSLILDKCRLTNIGNTCFLNSAIHFLFNIDSLRIYLAKISYEDIDNLQISNYININPVRVDIDNDRIQLYKNVIKAIKFLFDKMTTNINTNNTTPLNLDRLTIPNTSKKVFAILAELIATYERFYSTTHRIQSDPLEFIVCYLDIFKYFMDEQLLHIYKTYGFTICSCKKSKKGDSYQYSLLRNENMLRLESINDSDDHHLQSLIDNLFKSKEARVCDKVNTYNSIKTTEPDILSTFTETNTIIISVERSNKDGTTNTNRAIPSPILTIDGKNYTLQGCIVHRGTTATSGHYVYVVYDNKGIQLHVLDDLFSGGLSTDINNNGFVFLYKDISKPVAIKDEPCNFTITKPQPNLKIANFGQQLQPRGTRLTYEHEQRAKVLKDTLIKFETDSENGHKYYEDAQINMNKWCREAQTKETKQGITVIVEEVDWGSMALRLTKQYGKTFACLNMANSGLPGSGYTSGKAAQEENMFRRTNCHFSLANGTIIEHTKNKGESTIKYVESIKQQITGNGDSVYLDIENPRICIKGPEIWRKNDIKGYNLLNDDEIFPFYEMRVAAYYNKNKKQVEYDEANMDRLIRLQFTTLKSKNVRHAILGAFGCGDFNNPPERVACLYRKYLQLYEADFDVIGFPIYYAGHGLANFDVFSKALTFFEVNTTDFKVNPYKFSVSSIPYIQKKHTDYGATLKLITKEKYDEAVKIPIVNKTEDHKSIIRKWVLQDTLTKLKNKEKNYYSIALANITNWLLKINPRVYSIQSIIDCKIFVEDGDWGEIALKYTKRYGVIFACLNMANAETFGGGYIDGMAAQEENMFRRTDCHFSIEQRQIPDGEYDNKMKELIDGETGRVYFDWRIPRVCIKGKEDSNEQNLGYADLIDEEIFPFYELRAAAIDARTGTVERTHKHYNKDDTRKRIISQLETLIAHDVTCVILSAFGCGAFKNPPTEIAELYKQEIDNYKDYFRIIVFAIYGSYDKSNSNANLTAFQNSKIATHSLDFTNDTSVPQAIARGPAARGPIATPSAARPSVITPPPGATIITIKPGPAIRRPMAPNFNTSGVGSVEAGADTLSGKNFALGRQQYAIRSETSIPTKKNRSGFSRLFPNGGPKSKKKLQKEPSFPKGIMEDYGGSH